MKRFNLHHQKGIYKVEAETLLLGDDIIIAIWGGSEPHVGATAMAIPRPSLKKSETVSSTSSVLTRPGHKEDEIVKRFSETVSSALDCTVVVTAGMHWDNLPGGDIETIRSLCEELAQLMIDRITKEKS